MISETLRANTRALLAETRRSGRSPHEAALSIAQERVREAMRMRGQIPADAGTSTRGLVAPAATAAPAAATA